MKPHKTRKRFHWIAIFAMALWTEGEISAAEPGELSPGQHEILAELESRWWGWRGDPSPIVPAPKSCMSLHQQWPISAQQEVVVLIGTSPSEQESYIAEMLRREITGVYRVPCHVTSELGETSNPVICLGTPNSNKTLADLCRAAGVVDDALEQPESFAIDFFEDQEDGKKWILIAGGDSVGCIHGGFALTQLVQSSRGNLAINAFRIRDYPTVAVRSLRGVGESIGMKLQVHTDSRYLDRKITADEIHPDELTIPCRNVRYSLFYNGPRWLAYYHRTSPNTGGVLANFSRNAMYFPIYYGWHSTQYSPAVGWFINTTEQVQETFHEIIPRETRETTLLGNIANYSDSIFKGPVEYALWGHYCWHPQVHDTRQSEVMIGDSLLGRGNGQTMASLNRLLLDLTRVVYEDVTPPKDFLHTLSERFDLARKLHCRLKKGYESFRASVTPNHIPTTQHFYASLAIADIEKYLKKMEQVVELRGLYNGKPKVTPGPRYAGVIFPSASQETFFVSGGCRGGGLTGCYDDLWKYDTREDRWEPLKVPVGMMSARCGHSAVVIGNEVFFFGGTSEAFVDVRNSLHVFDVENATYREITDTQGRLPAERLVHGACADEQGRMWIFGGMTTDRKTLGDLWCYDPDENRWDEIVDAHGDPPGERYGTRLACVGDKLYLFGGNRQEGPLLNDLYRFDPEQRHWTQLETASDERPSPRYAPACVTVGKRIYLFGGGGNGFRNDLWTYDVAAELWERLAPSGEIPGPRGCPLPYCSDGRRIYLFSGAQSAADYGTWINGDLYVYEIAENKFAKLQSSITW